PLHPSESAWCAALPRGSAGVGGRPLDELLGALIVLEHYPSIERRELDSPRDDGGQHRLEIERGADRLTNLPERLKLADRATEFPRSHLQLGQQAGVLDGNHGLVCEGLEERDLVGGEAAGLAPGHRNGPGRLVLTEQWHYDPASVATGTGVGT